MPLTIEDVLALETLETRLRLLLPEQYQDSYETLLPVPMRSAGLKYNASGSVAWNDMWATFCDLSMAGGPPHRGTLLEPPPAGDIATQPEAYDHVAGEICRGIRMVADLPASPSSEPGWIQVECASDGMAEWLVRAIVMENVLARCEGRTIFLPAGPAFRLHKEIKNVIAVMAKTCHYWTGHIPPEQQLTIDEVLTAPTRQSQLLGPASLADIRNGADNYRALATAMADSVRAKTGLPCFSHRYFGWLGVDCPNVRSAIWMMRALVVSNVLSRREDTNLFFPVNPINDPHGARVMDAFLKTHHLAHVKKIL